MSATSHISPRARGLKCFERAERRSPESTSGSSARSSPRSSTMLARAGTSAARHSKRARGSRRRRVAVTLRAPTVDGPRAKRVDSPKTLPAVAVRDRGTAPVRALSATLTSPRTTRQSPGSARGTPMRQSTSAARSSRGTIAAARRRRSGSERRLKAGLWARILRSCSACMAASQEGRGKRPRAAGPRQARRRALRHPSGFTSSS